MATEQTISEASPDLNRQNEQVLLSEAQLLLSEKRTYFSLVRTGLAVFTVPLSVMAVLVASSGYHKIFDRPNLTLVIFGGLVIISLVGLLIFFQSELKIRRLNKLIKAVERANRRVDEIII